MKSIFLLIPSSSRICNPKVCCLRILNPVLIKKRKVEACYKPSHTTETFMAYTLCWCFVVYFSRHFCCIVFLSVHRSGTGWKALWQNLVVCVGFERFANVLDSEGKAVCWLFISKSLLFYLPLFPAQSNSIQLCHLSQTLQMGSVSDMF